MTAPFPASVEVITFEDACGFVSDNTVHSHHDVQSLAIYTISDDQNENFVVTISPIDPCLKIKTN